MAHYYRHPKTTQERRANQDGWGRSKRNFSNLVDSYDDVYVNRRDRSWKNYRKTQYKPKIEESKKDSSKYAKHMAYRCHFHHEHKWCDSRYWRCNNCWKKGVFKEQDKIIDREYAKQQKKYEEERRKREREWLQYCWSNYWKTN